MLRGYPFLGHLWNARDPSDVQADPLGYNADSLAAVRDAAWMAHAGRANVEAIGETVWTLGGRRIRLGEDAVSMRATAQPRRGFEAGVGAEPAGDRGKRPCRRGRGPARQGNRQTLGGKGGLGGLTPGSKDLDAGSSIFARPEVNLAQSIVYTWVLDSASLVRLWV
jgi:hypothetical protein